jgi:hypothetical protein
MARGAVPLSCCLLLFIRLVSAILTFPREDVTLMVLLYSICYGSECALSALSDVHFYTVVRKLLDPILNIFSDFLPR